MGRLFARRGKAREQADKRHPWDELLSAYLDGQLSAGERARLEARLATDPELQAELDALRQTVALVRDLPPVPLPRNFILPQTADKLHPKATRPRSLPSPRSRRAWAAPLLTAATTVVSLLFGVVLAADLWFSSAGRLALAPAAEPLLEAEAPRPQAFAPSPVIEEAAAEVEVEAEAGKAVPAATPLPMPTDVFYPPQPPREAPAEAAPEAEQYTGEVPENAEPAAPAVDEGPTEEPAPPPPAASGVAATPTAPAMLEGLDAAAPGVGTGSSGEESVAPTSAPGLPVVEEVPIVSTVPAEAPTMPAEGVEVTEPAAGWAAEAPEAPPSAVEEGERDEAAVERGAPEDDVANGRFLPALAPIAPWRVLEVVLGLVALGLALVTVRTWRVRRR
jgi:anti-sigma factor RsiW